MIEDEAAVGRQSAFRHLNCGCRSSARPLAIGTATLDQLFTLYPRLGCQRPFLEWRDDDRFLCALDNGDQLLPLRLRNFEPIETLLEVIHERLPLAFGDHEIADANRPLTDQCTFAAPPPPSRPTRSQNT